MLPLRDENPAERTPWVTYAIIAVNVAVYLLQLQVGVDRSALMCGAIPAELTTGADLVGTALIDLGGHAVSIEHLACPLPWPGTLLTAMFMHGSVMHIGGNLWCLWIFGDNVEDVLGPAKYIVFYLLVGIAGTLLHVAVDPLSQSPMIGASGAIAGVMGAYAFLYPRAPVLTLGLPIMFYLRLPAWVVIGEFFIAQFFIDPSSGVAWAAHVGGFLAGVVLRFAFVWRRPERRVWTGYRP